MTIEEIIDLAKLEVLDLAYTISKKIDLSTVRDEQIQAGQLISLIRVLEDDESQLSEEDRLQLSQGLISIGNLTII
jgi:hypothetical protein